VKPARPTAGASHFRTGITKKSAGAGVRSRGACGTGNTRVLGRDCQQRASPVRIAPGTRENELTVRDYIEQLVADGEVRIVEREVDPRFELAAVVSRSQAESDAAVLFRTVRGSTFPVVSNVFGSYRRMCRLIGAAERDFCRRWNEILDAPPAFEGRHLVDVATPADVADGTLDALPHITYFERDAGPYITAGVFLAAEPDTGVPNLSFSRTMMVSNEELRIRLGPPHDLANYQRKAEARDAPLEAAILIGPPPEVFLAACASVPYEVDETALAARIRGAAIPVRPCRTIGLRVPAETEIVIEGRILPHVRRSEGPFGEFQGYYVPAGLNHVFEVSHVSWRRGANFHALVCGSPEDLRALDLSIAARIYRALASELPGILDVTCLPTPQQTVVQIRQAHEGHAGQVLLKAFGSHMQYNKIVIVVDEDVDIHDFNDVWWAVVTRCRVDRRVMVIPEVPGFYRNEAEIHYGRLGIDATKPFDRQDLLERKRIPGAAELDPDRYFTRGRT
jgi:4-hydroxybenzoate decarboxylase